MKTPTKLSVDAASSLLAKKQALASTRSQRIDMIQANKLQSTLRHFKVFKADNLKNGDPLPPCYHFAYFTPDHLAESQLGRDGADITFNPVAPFSRRMWAGGKLNWNKDNPLLVGDEVQEHTKLDDVICKRTRDGTDMIVVTVEKTYHNRTGHALTEHRSWLFREPKRSEQSNSTKISDAIQPMEGSMLGQWQPSATTLFRYSAVTFNSHKIHLDKDWCLQEEGQRDLVVHAPLTITMLANALPQLTSLTYKARSPFFVNELCQIRRSQSTVSCTGPRGNTIMEASFT